MSRRIHCDIVDIPSSPPILYVDPQEGTVPPSERGGAYAGVYDNPDGAPNPNRVSFHLCDDDHPGWGSTIRYGTTSLRYEHTPNAPGDYEGPALVPQNVDPSNIPLTELAKVCGAMWSSRWSGRYGPRPGQPDNILAMDYYESYEPAERQQMRDIYTTGRPYTHAVTGPLVDEGYHGQYPAVSIVSQVDFDRYLDCMQEWWDHPRRIIPVHFVTPNAWSEAQLEQLWPLYRQPRAQQLLRVVVLGWEPTDYGWPNAEWVRRLKKMSEVFPNALWLVHTWTEIDAMVGGSDDPVVQRAQQSGTWAEAWANIVPYLHGWLMQVGPYQTAPSADPTLAGNFEALFRPRVSGSMWQRFHLGYAGWPTFSAWGASTPLKVYNAECTAYTSYWRNLPEASAQAWGDLAMQSGSDGFLDGGTVSVP